MWIVIIVIVIVLIVGNFLKNLNKQTRKIEKEGGMKHKYRQLIKLILDEDLDSRIFFAYKERVDLGLRNIDGETVFSLILGFGNLEVKCRIKSITNGDHEMKWEFPEYYDQNKMYERIKSELSKYLNNVFSSQFIAETSEDRKDTERNVSLLRMASNMKCDPSKVKEKFFKDFEKQEFDKVRLNNVIQIFESKKNEEAKIFNIDPENTGAALMIEWAEEYFEKKQKDKIERNKLISTVLEENTEFAKIVKSGQNTDKYLAQNPETLDSIISILAYPDAGERFYNDAFSKYECDKNEQAISIVNKGLKLENKKYEPLLLDLRSLIQFDNGEYSESLKDSNMAIESLKINSPTDYHLFNIFLEERMKVKLKLGMEKEAINDKILAEKYKAMINE